MTRKCVTIKKREVCTENVDRWSLSKMSVETLIEIGLLSVLVIILESAGVMMIEIVGNITRSDIEAALVILAFFTVSFFISNLLSHLVMTYIKSMSRNTLGFVFIFSAIETVLFLVIFQVIVIASAAVLVISIFDTFTGMRGISFTFLIIAFASVLVSNAVATRFYAGIDKDI